MAIEGEVFVDQFREEKIKAQNILEFIKRIEVVPDAELDRLGPDYRHATICRVETEDGGIFEKRVDFAKGGINNPITPQEVVDKFRKLTTKVLPEKKVEGIYKTVLNMENASSLTELTDCLVP